MFGSFARNMPASSNVVYVFVTLNKFENMMYKTFVIMLEVNLVFYSYIVKVLAVMFCN